MECFVFIVKFLGTLLWCLQRLLFATFSSLCLSWSALSSSSSSLGPFFGAFRGFFLPPSPPFVCHGVLCLHRQVPWDPSLVPSEASFCHLLLPLFVMECFVFIVKFLGTLLWCLQRLLFATFSSTHLLVVLLCEGCVT